MTELFMSEWERIWARRKTMVSFVIVILLSAMSTFLLQRGGIGFVTADLEVPLHALNFPVFLLKELGFVLSFVLLPMFFVDSFNGEYSSGAYRLVLVRPQSRKRLLLAKWSSMAAVIGIFLTIVFLFSQIAGWILYSAPSSVSFYPGEPSYSIVGAFGYSLLYYLIFFLIYLALLGLTSFISSIMPNAILAFFSIIAVILATLYAPESLHYFLMNGQTTFQVLNGTGLYPFFGSLLTIILLSYGLVYGIWERKDWIK
ncbi:ABC transporter permease [Marininema halotolerans]|uniref:ABC-2 family transporter protein n=1 Tax=Marininema halotolerans TaxID=1155944 RepID=A0A1I6UHB1_9BACL|nr:ABC transporter permease subunit [Marininema halotolerans]SFT00822.1 ABC-2 family transporter protein [Marininema halotolerans]